MANDNKKLTPVPLSQLPEIDDPAGFLIFGSKEADGRLISGYYRFEGLADYARNLQLERRIQLAMETSETEMYIGETMEVYEVKGYNAGKVLIAYNDELFDTDEDMPVTLPADTIVRFMVTSELTDAKRYLYLKARITVN